MYRIIFKPRLNKWVIQIKKFIWLSVLDEDTGFALKFETYNLAKRKVGEIGIDKIYTEVKI